jgi:polyisoprenoid-binding protein YceI
MGWTFDPAHTMVGFSARYMGLTTVRGRFTRFEGTIELDPDDLTRTRGRVEVDMASVDTNDETRDGHLRSPDFFDVENHPKMVFEPTSVSRVDEDHYKVNGNLTIRGETRPVEFAYEHSGEGKDAYGKRKLAGRLTGTIKRSDWGLKWNVALEAGGWLVSDKITIEIEGQVAQSEDAPNDEVKPESEQTSA